MSNQVYTGEFRSLAGRIFAVSSSPATCVTHAVFVSFGPVGLFLAADEAQALGTRLIAAADHYRRAARAVEPVEA